MPINENNKALPDKTKPAGMPDNNNMNVIEINITAKISIVIIY